MPLLSNCIVVKKIMSNPKKNTMHLILQLGIAAGILLLVLLISFANKINQKY
jgi:hypothetical protein